MHLDNAYDVNEEDCYDEDTPNTRRIFKSAERSVKHNRNKEWTDSLNSENRSPNLHKIKAQYESIQYH